MLSKSEIKLINSLQQKKHQNKHGLFIVEGKKSVLEFIDSNFELKTIFFTDDFTSKVPQNKLVLITQSELKKISALKNPKQILGVFKIPEIQKVKESNLILVLDNIQDPGNLGAIIRLCDWFGVKQLICSLDTVSCYNPKVVQASMGSLTRVSINYENLNTYLSTTNLPIYVSLLEGENIYKSNLPKNAILVMGNEGNGISESIIKLATHSMHIPRFGNTLQAESLNVASATAIILSEFKR